LADNNRKRFTVSLDAATFRRLELLRKRSKPTLSKTYVVAFALNHLFDAIEGGQLALGLDGEFDRGDEN